MTPGLPSNGAGSQHRVCSHRAGVAPIGRGTDPCQDSHPAALSLSRAGAALCILYTISQFYDRGCIDNRVWKWTPPGRGDLAARQGDDSAVRTWSTVNSLSRQIGKCQAGD